MFFTRMLPWCKYWNLIRPCRLNTTRCPPSTPLQYITPIREQCTLFTRDRRTAPQSNKFIALPCGPIPASHKTKWTYLNLLAQNMEIQNSCHDVIVCQNVMALDGGKYTSDENCWNAERIFCPLHICNWRLTWPPFLS